MVTVRERILAIRLLEQQDKQPAFFEKLGIHVTMEKIQSTVDERKKIKCLN